MDVANGSEILHSTSYGQGISNPNEAELVALIIQLLTKLPTLKSRTIGVVTFSLQQRHDIADRIRSK